MKSLNASNLVKLVHNIVVKIISSIQKKWMIDKYCI